MASIAAENVGKDVLDSVRRGKRPVLGKIIRKRGYALTTSTVPTQVTRTKSYQRVVKPVAVRWEKERERITKAMETTALDTVEYKDLAKVLDTLTQNIQLLTGGATANLANQILVKFLDVKAPDNRDSS